MMSQVIVDMKNFEDIYIERAARIEPAEYIMVIDPNTQELIGEVVNFNNSGMQLLMHSEMELNLILEFSGWETVYRSFRWTVVA